MPSKPGRKWAELRGDYTEVRELARVLRDIVDSRGLRLRALEQRLPYGHSLISDNLNGSKRPSWEFVTDLLGVCAGNDQRAGEILEQRVKPLWEAAAPGLAHPTAEMAPISNITVPEEEAWRVAVREAANAQQVVFRLQLSINRQNSAISGLWFMMGRLVSATEDLTAERDRFAEQLRQQAGLAEELRRTRTKLDIVQQKLDVAEWLRNETSRRLEEAIRRSEEAERLKRDAMAQADAARQQLAELEQHQPIVLADSEGEESETTGEITIAHSETNDRTPVVQILRRFDDGVHSRGLRIGSQ